MDQNIDSFPIDPRDDTDSEDDKLGLITLCDVTLTIYKRGTMALTLHQWLVFFSGYIVYGLSVGLYYGMGALFPVIMDTFDATRAQSSVIQSIYAACLFAGGIIYGMITSKFGAVKAAVMGSLATSASLVVAFWATKLTYLIATSVVTAIGLGMCLVSCTVGVRQFFHGRSSVVALALISSSSSTTGIALTYILRHLSDSFGLRGTFLVIGGIELNCTVLCLLWNPHLQQSKKETTINDGNADQEQIGNSDDSASDSSLSTNCSATGSRSIHETTTTIKKNEFNSIYTKGQVNDGYSAETEIGQKTNNISKDVNIDISDKSKKDCFSDQKNKLGTKTKLKHLLRNPSYVLTIVGLLFSLRSLSPYVVFLLDMYRDHDYTISQGTTGLMIVNLAGVLGKAAPAVIAHCPFYNMFLLPACSTLLASIAMFSMTLAPTVVVFHILSGCLGFGLGVVISVVVVTVSELVEPEYLAEAVGLLMSSNGAFALVSGLVTGHLRDTSGSYVIPHIITSAFTGLGSVMFIIAGYLQRRKNLRVKYMKTDTKSEVTRL